MIKRRMEGKTPEKRIVYIKSGVDVDYGQVVRAIDTIRKQDIDKIGLVADKKKGGETAANRLVSSASLFKELMLWECQRVVARKEPYHRLT